MNLAKPKTIKDFNSHAHVERDNSNLQTVTTRTNFNSHAHVERDHTYYPKYREKIISTHTLTWSVTIPQEQEQQLYLISTHTLTWSVTNV